MYNKGLCRSHGIMTQSSWAVGAEERQRVESFYLFSCGHSVLLSLCMCSSHREQWCDWEAEFAGRRLSLNRTRPYAPADSRFVFLLLQTWAVSLSQSCDSPVHLLYVSLFTATRGGHHRVLCRRSRAGGVGRHVLQQLLPLPAVCPGPGPEQRRQPVGAERAPGRREVSWYTGPLTDGRRRRRGVAKRDQGGRVVGHGDVHLGINQIL